MKFKRSIIDESKVIGFKLLIEFGLKHLVKGKGNKNFKRIFFFLNKISRRASSIIRAYTKFNGYRGTDWP